jgi:hypothetical protein
MIEDAAPGVKSKTSTVLLEGQQISHTGGIREAKL